MVWTEKTLVVSPVANARVSVLGVKSVAIAVLPVAMEVVTTTC